MKKRQAAAALLTMAMIGTALAGCGSTDGASATESSEAAAEETAEDIGAEAEEAADAEDTAAEDAAGEEEAEADGEEFMPADFIQERAGTNEFDDYEDILRYLEGDEGYAYISIDGSTAYVLAVSDELYAWDDNTNAAMGVSLYAYDADGKLSGSAHVTVALTVLYVIAGLGALGFVAALWARVRWGRLHRVRRPL